MGSLGERLRAVEVEVKNMRMEFVDLKSNHLKGIRDDINCLFKKMDKLKGSPSWVILAIITFLTSLSIGLLVAYLK